MTRILIAEDDVHIRQLMVHYLTHQGFECTAVQDGQMAITLMESENFDALITDLMMPHLDGFGLAHRVRSLYPHLPILMLTALDTLPDKEKGFLSGADDYLVKPIDMKELTLHLHALLRRYGINQSQQIKLRNTLLDAKRYTCIIHGKDVHLTRKEFQLLFKLLSYPHVIFTREQLMNDLWGYDSDSYDRTVDTHIKRIREQIQVEDFEIITVRGLGYKAVLK